MRRIFDPYPSEMAYSFIRNALQLSESHFWISLMQAHIFQARMITGS